MRLCVSEPFDEVPEAVLEADDFHAVRDNGLDRDRRNDAVNARSGAAADEDAESLALNEAGHDGNQLGEYDRALKQTGEAANV